MDTADEQLEAKKKALMEMRNFARGEMANDMKSRYGKPPEPVEVPLAPGEPSPVAPPPAKETGSSKLQAIRKGIEAFSPLDPSDIEAIKQYLGSLVEAQTYKPDVHDEET